MWYWLAAIPLLVEFAWLCTYLPRWQRWRAGRREIERKQGMKLNPVDDVDAVYVVVALRQAREGRASQALVEGDLRWSKRFLSYHIPGVFVLAFIVERIPSPLMRFGACLISVMIITALMYGMAIAFSVAAFS